MAYFYSYRYKKEGVILNLFQDLAVYYCSANLHATDILQPMQERLRALGFNRHVGVIASCNHKQNSATNKRVILCKEDGTPQTTNPKQQTNNI
ncbi:MAG: hypothetical protein U0T75_01120 [Chitinophagales bacterium]